MLWCLQDLTFKCTNSRSLQMCKMRFSNSFYTHEYRPDSRMKLLLNQILRWLTFIHNCLIQRKIEHKMGDRNYSSLETSQVLPESDTRKISLGGRKWKRPRTWALLVSTTHAVPVEKGAVSKHHRAPSPRKGAKSKNYVEGLLVCRLMRSKGWTEVSTVQIADFSCWTAVAWSELPTCWDQQTARRCSHQRSSRHQIGV